MTPAHPRHRLWACAAAFAMVTAVSGPATAAPRPGINGTAAPQPGTNGTAGPQPGTNGTAAPCGHAQRYAAQSGTELLRLDRLDLRPLGRRDAPVTEVGLAAAQSAMVAQSGINSAAATRLLDAVPTGRAASATLAQPVYQQAPPTNSQPAEVSTAAGQIGPLTVGTGRLSAYARWQPGWACAADIGEMTRVQAQLSRTTILPGSSERYLVRVPRGVQSLGTTALQRHGAQVDVVAHAEVTMTQLEVLDGAVRIRFVRPPALSTTISAAKGSAEVRYLPPVLEVSGRGIATQRLDSAGDEVTVPMATARTDTGRTDTGSIDSADPLSQLLAAVAPAAFGPLGPDSDRFPALPGLPPRPGMPAIAERQPESAPDVPGETQLRISLGDVRQATSGHAVAARATAVRLEIDVAAAPERGRPGGQVLDLGLGVLEVASVAPDPESPPGGVGGAALPVTGARVDLMLLVGGSLLLAGFGFLLFGLLRRSARP